MARIPGVNHLAALRALEKAGFRILRQGKHIVMTDGTHILTIPRNNPINAFTMGVIVRNAGLTVEEFRRLL
jgi:predicted RNA binding protein YcfA (HicA-like mRNA interferase family)